MKEILKQLGFTDIKEVNIYECTTQSNAKILLKVEDNKIYRFINADRWIEIDLEIREDI